MFDEKQLEQYRSVKASPELRESVMSLEKSGKVYAFNRKTVSAIAACLVAVIALSSYFGISGNMNAELVYQPYQTASLYRLSEESVLVKLDIKGEYEVSVSQGSFSFDNGERVATAKLNGETEIEWFVPTEGESALTLKKGLIIRQYRLCFDEELQAWQLEEV